jgi:putative ABC transport system permease protein
MFSMHLPIQPLMISHSESRGRFISIKVNPEELPHALASIEKVTKQHSVYPFEYQFLSEEYDRLYSSELKLGEIFRYFTLLSILIASLGLFGLAALMAGQRTKEIGIRKVLGASGQHVVFLLSRDFGKWILAAIVISIPLGWYAMETWLMDFAYRVSLAWWVFALAGLSAFIIAGISVGFQSVKASLANPVDSLRSE